MDPALEKNIRAYNEKLPELLASIGKFALFYDGLLVGLFDAYADALRAGYAKDADGRFFVKRIAPAEQVAFFSRDLSIECRVSP